MNEIAIASVPVQEWEAPYPSPQALQKGCIFPQLHMPFFVEEQMMQEAVTQAAPVDECEARLLEIQQVTFFLIDLQLFLDTHPDHAEAKQLKRQYQQARKELLAKFALDFYPLTTDCQGEQTEEVIPWGGGREHVAV